MEVEKKKLFIYEIMKFLVTQFEVNDIITIKISE